MVAAGLVSVVVAGCGTGGISDLQAALCEDLNAGRSFAQVLPAVLRYHEDAGRSDARASTWVFVEEAVREGCPDQVDAWEATRFYGELAP